MATSNPLHPDVSSRFREEHTPNSWGVTNAQLQTGRAAKTPNRPRVEDSNKAFTQYAEPDIAANENWAPQALPQPREKRGRFKQTIVENVARVRASPVAVAISAFATPWYFIVQLPLALLATVFITLGYRAQLLADSSVVAEYALESVAGFSSDVFLVLYLAFSGILCFFYFCQIIIGTVLFKMAFIHPWFGRGVSFKIGSIMTILIGSFVPILNMFPLLALWVTAVVFNPK